MRPRNMNSSNTSAAKIAAAASHSGIVGSATSPAYRAAGNKSNDRTSWMYAIPASDAATPQSTGGLIGDISLYNFLRTVPLELHILVNGCYNWSSAGDGSLDRKSVG